jgi:hypothetical protein
MGLFTKLLITVAVGFVTMLVIGSIHKRDPAVAEKFRQKDVIKTCWEEQARKSLDPGTARFVASTCERMEGDFIEKYRERP